MASIEDVANTLYGNESSILVIRTALSGINASDASPILTPLLTRLTTDIDVTSLPVPQVVGIIISG